MRILKTPYGGLPTNTRTTTTQLQKKPGQSVKDLAIKELSNKRLFVVDAFCGANKDTRMAIRFIVEVAWQAHFRYEYVHQAYRGRIKRL